MKQTFIFTFILLSTISFGQKGSTLTPSYYNINIDSKIYEIVAPNGTLENIAGDAGGITGEALQAASDVTEGADNPVSKFHKMAHEGILTSTKTLFKEKLQIDIAPLNTLKGKINFFTNGYPSQQSFKKVMKKAAGEDFYLSYSVRMYKKSAPVGVGSVGGLDVGGKIKPVTEIALVIADAKGKVVQEFDVKEKTDIVIGSTKTSVGNIDTSSGEDPEVVLEKFLQVYETALGVLVEDYLKKNKKQYK